MKIIFWERTLGSNFPEFYSQIEVLETQKNLAAAAGGTFTVGDIEISFSESVHDNGWWAKKPGQPGRCRVTIEM